MKEEMSWEEFTYLSTEGVPNEPGDYFIFDLDEEENIRAGSIPELKEQNPMIVRLHRKRVKDLRDAGAFMILGIDIHVGDEILMATTMAAPSSLPWEIAKHIFDGKKVWYAKIPDFKYIQPC